MFCKLTARNSYRPFSRDVIERTAAILEALEGGEEQ